MRRARVLLIVLAISLVAGGAALAARVVKVGALANGKTITLRPSDRLVVTLPGNASTGFFWRVQRLDRHFVKFVSRVYVPNTVPPGKTGASGKYVLRFRAVAPGTTPLKLVYVQSDSPSAKPAKRFRLSLVVKAPPPRV